MCCPPRSSEHPYTGLSVLVPLARTHTHRERGRRTYSDIPLGPKLQFPPHRIPDPPIIFAADTRVAQPRRQCEHTVRRALAVEAEVVGLPHCQRCALIRVRWEAEGAG